MSQLWKELHTNAISYTGIDNKSFLNNFGKNIPRYTSGCACNEFWKKWLKANPPVYGDNGEYFAWTVKAHNAVNTKLKKPQLTVDEAKKLYI